MVIYLKISSLFFFWNYLIIKIDFNDFVCIIKKKIGFLLFYLMCRFERNDIVNFDYVY